MARTREIDRNDWARFLDHLSAQARGRPVRLQVEDRDLGDQELGSYLPLNGFEYDTKGSRTGSLEISLGPDMSHWISNATRLYSLENDAGEIECIGIMEEGGGKSLLYFQHPLALPQGEIEPEAPAPGP